MCIRDRKSLKLYTEISKNCPLKLWKDRLVAVWGEETKDVYKRQGLEVITLLRYNQSASGWLSEDLIQGKYAGIVAVSSIAVYKRQR